jgi:hypothetical protein
MEIYAPLDQPKALGRDIWIVDGPSIRFYAMPFPTRMTVIRLRSGDLMLISPLRLTDALRGRVASLGRVAHLISPNWIHYAYLGEWKRAFPQATVWASPGVRERARKHRSAVEFDCDLGGVPAPWESEVAQLLVEGSSQHREWVFFHRASATLVLTDLIENFEARALPWWARPLARWAGVLAPDGKAPIDMRWTFRRGRNRLRAAVAEMIAWKPRTIIVAHGRCFQGDGAAELRRAFRWAGANLRHTNSEPEAGS